MPWVTCQRHSQHNDHLHGSAAVVLLVREKEREAELLRNWLPDSPPLLPLAVPSSCTFFPHTVSNDDALLPQQRTSIFTLSVISSPNTSSALQ